VPTRALPARAPAQAKVVGTARRPTQRKRAAWGSVTRELVVESALRIVEDDGYEQLTVRGLAAHMGVAPMTLYHHVSNKDDLLDEVVDRLLERSWRPPGKMEKGPWTWLGEAAERLRQFLVDQPAALHVYLSHPVVSPSALARMDEMLRALSLGGLDEQEARRAYAAVHSYTVGFAALQASRAGWRPAPGTKPIALQLSAYTTPKQFKEGLSYTLEGIGRRAGVSFSLPGHGASFRGKGRVAKGSSPNCANG
jgi:TetR/AcrR family tetracycline transcriptional repressor